MTCLSFGCLHRRHTLDSTNSIAGGGAPMTPAVSQTSIATMEAAAAYMELRTGLTDSEDEDAADSSQAGDDEGRLPRSVDM